MPNIQIAVINASSVLSDIDVQNAVPALQTQVSDHFAPAWGIDATLSFVSKKKKQKPAKGQWWLTVLDNSDQAGALGYHDVTNEGLPLGKVFAGTDKQYNLSWTCTASHELLEMLADPDIDLTVFAQPNATTGILYAYEVCDPCEDDNDGYKIGDVLVSDFVYPSYFETWRKPGSTKFDHMNKLKAPIPKMLKGGYLSVYHVNSGAGWTQVDAQEGPAKRFARNAMRARVGSRRERRRVPRDQWVPSARATG